jgi:hypothetical protein
MMALRETMQEEGRAISTVYTGEENARETLRF